MNFPIFKFCLNEGVNENFLPKQGTPLSTGYDVKSTEHLILKPFERKLINLGIRCIIPDGWWLDLRPRSSTFAKKKLHCLQGVIDVDYSGQILLAVQYIPEADNTEVLEIKIGDPIGQLIPVERKQMITTIISKEDFEAEVSMRNDARGSGGFGSTSK